MEDRPMKAAISATVVCSLLLLAPCAARAAATDNAVKAMSQGDYERALKELRPLVEKNDPDAQCLMGMMYDAGKGVPQDQAIAASWYRKAAEQKQMTAQLFLGAMYFTGTGVARDYRQAARWLQAPANAGNAEAQFYLGAMHAEGNGVGKDEAEAIEWLTKSSAQKNTRAMGMLTALLFARHQSERDLVDAYVWSHLAAEYDPIQATTSARAVTEKYCNPAQAKAAKKSMAEWKKKWALASK